MENLNLEMDKIIQKYKDKKGVLIPLLQDVQKLEGYLSKSSMKYVAEQFEVNLADIYGVATFYAMFRLKPQGKHVIRICKGTACHVSGANAILTALRVNLNLDETEETSADGLFTLIEVACLGCCSLAPVIMVDDTTHAKLTPESVTEVLKKYN